MSKEAVSVPWAAEQEVDARKAAFIRRGLDVFFVVYLIFCVGVMVLMVKVSENWWDPWPAVVVLSPICVATLWLTPKMKEVYIALYAMKTESDLSTKLLGSEN
ncbi:hypothetical protein BS78_05G235200 [Paspalum vaginatum]|nr:hypothetical protein BS78_05G235200 [Paspalum vaginatum]